MSKLYVVIGYRFSRLDIENIWGPYSSKEADEQLKFWENIGGAAVKIEISKALWGNGEVFEDESE